MHEQLTRAAVAKAIGVIEECGEMWDDPLAWQHHLAAWTEREVGGVLASVFIMDARKAINDPPQRDQHHLRVRADVLDVAIGDAHDETAMKMRRTWMSERAFEWGPSLPDIMQAIRQKTSMAQQYSKLDADAYVEYFERYITPPGAHRAAVAAAGCQTGNHMTVILSRSLTERPFPAAKLALLRTVVEAAAFRCEARWTTRAQRGRHEISARTNQVLGALLEGDSEKQVAMRLGITIHTVHEHVTALYRHFDAHSRGELTAHFLRKKPLPRRTCR